MRDLKVALAYDSRFWGSSQGFSKKNELQASSLWRAHFFGRTQEEKRLTVTVAVVTTVTVEVEVRTTVEVGVGMLRQSQALERAVVATDVSQVGTSGLILR